MWPRHHLEICELGIEKLLDVFDVYGEGSGLISQKGTLEFACVEPSAWTRMEVSPPFHTMGP
jgi:hypothetical protein